MIEGGKKHPTDEKGFMVRGGTSEKKQRERQYRSRSRDGRNPRKLDGNTIFYTGRGRGEK